MRTGVVLVLFFCAGCTTTQQAMERANSSYRGRNIDELVLTFGIPYGEHQLNDGRKVYTWSLGQESYYMPAHTVTSGHVNSFGHFSSSSQTYGGGVSSVFCDIEVVTSNDGTIIHISALRDTWGKWTTSRCAEIFK